MRERVSASPARLAALWFGIQATWSAVLGIVLQSRSETLDPAHGVATYSVVATIGAVVATLAQLAAGAGSDALLPALGHRRGFYAAGIAVAIVALYPLFVAPAVPFLIAAFIALQIGMNVANGPYQAAIPDHVEPQHEGLAAAWMGALSSAGAVAGLLVATSTRGAATALVLAAILAASFGITFAEVARLPRSTAAATPLRTRLDRRARTLLVSRSAVFLGFYTLFGFMFFFMRETLGVADARTTTGIVFLAFTIAAIAGAAAAARPTDRLDKRVVIVVSGGVIVLGVLAFASAPALPIAIGAAVLSGAAWGAFTTADWAIAFEVLPRGAMATAMGMWNLAVTLPQVAAPLITAPLVSALDARRAGLGPRAALVAVALEIALGAAWLWRLGPLRSQVAGANASPAHPDSPRFRV